VLGNCHANRKPAQQRAGRKWKKKMQENKENYEPCPNQFVDLDRLIELREKPNQGALQRVNAVARLQDALDLLEDLEKCNVVDPIAISSPAKLLQGKADTKHHVYPSLAPALLSPRVTDRETWHPEGYFGKNRFGGLTGSLFGGCLGTSQSTRCIISV
jgi:hypothetical protein